MTIDHTQILLPNSSYNEVLKLYEAALKPLGYEIRLNFGPTVTGMGHGELDGDNYKRCDLWLTGVDVTPNVQVHLAFAAKDKASVDAFHAAALQHGGEDNGAPGIRSHYHEGYYAAFFKDPLGNNIEAVCHQGAN